MDGEIRSIRFPSFLCRTSRDPVHKAMSATMDGVHGQTHSVSDARNQSIGSASYANAPPMAWWLSEEQAKAEQKRLKYQDRREKRQGFKTKKVFEC